MTLNLLDVQLVQSLESKWTLTAMTLKFATCLPHGNLDDTRHYDAYPDSSAVLYMESLLCPKLGAGMSNGS